MGDLNGRTNIVNDFVVDESDKHSPINNPIYRKDIPLSRNNQDLKPVDQQGKIIIEFCKSASYTILNGRTQGDMSGKYTRYPKKMGEMPSVIDYSICGSNVIDQVHSFSVLPFTGMSDHCCISTCVRVNIADEMDVEDDNENVHPINVKYTYDKRHKKGLKTT